MNVHLFSESEDAFDLFRTDGDKWGYPKLMVFRFRRIPLNSLLPDVYEEGLEDRLRNS